MLSHKPNTVLCADIELTDEQIHTIARALNMFMQTKRRRANAYKADNNPQLTKLSLQDVENAGKLHHLMRSAFRVKVTA